MLAKVLPYERRSLQGAISRTIDQVDGDTHGLAGPSDGLRKHANAAGFVWLLRSANDDVPSLWAKAHVVCWKWSLHVSSARFALFTRSGGGDFYAARHR